VIAAKFSTTTATSSAATEAVLMSAMKNYFDFGIMTACGIQSVSLTGTEDEWVSLRTRTEELGKLKLMTKDFSKYWIPLMLSLLDEFVESYRGNVNHGFW
jgi:hypothetical protein